ncbi:hypothetical protein MAR_018991 [Mya arenaria]|uniref:Uncharacterized protein n=1 Tax=Mya arenaria TaxID=6604 RepID=A0ABY7DS58_MYAAR|nr:uncharacterized protein LOC128228701 [Mya arenaria]XP_052802770.1 uncharacterized protein LOC128232981 [Mya arenaria]WAR00538.1 hypothetical protein MAR_024910 [Mya arenaria]WAR02070.1 hypothetical protein MAR_008628 [Mya arenaria]WAR09033.1 hypothetical protein MAR_018991 [Mya arenaria]
MADKLSHVSSFSVKEMCEWVDSISKDLTTIFKDFLLCCNNYILTKKKELRTETTPGGAATSTATTHRSSARSPNHSQAQSAPDNIMVDVSRFGRRRVPKRFDEYIM